MNVEADAVTAWYTPSPVVRELGMEVAMMSE